MRADFNGDGGSTCVELFSGNGRGRLRDTGEFIDGSPLIALNEANHPFTDLIFAELDPENVVALGHRVGGTPRARIVPGDCNATIQHIVSMIPRRAYNLALIDPFGASALQFETIRRLACFDRMDMIIHFPTGSMKRNFIDFKKYESLLGLPVKDWGVNIVHGTDIPKLMNVMRRQLCTLGYEERHVMTNTPRVMNTSNTVLYHLMFVSKHPLGDKIWNSVTKHERNGQLRLMI